MNNNILIDVNSLNRDAGHNVSEKYKVIKTGDLVKSFETQGYQVRELQEQRTRKVELKGYGKHMLRLRHPDLKINNEGLFPEIVLRNSYNGTSTFEIMMGIFRLVCSNGLVVGTTYESLKVRHVGDVVPKVIAALSNIQSQTLKIGDDINRFSSVKLTDSQSLEFATEVGRQLVPVGNSELSGPISSTIQYVDLLKVNRSLDNSNDLFTVMNRIQENALNGNLSYLTRNVQGNVRNASSRRIRSIDRNIEVNRLVWDIAATYAKIG